jgi:3-deoxy-D-manno-octulosonic-acid transferase
LYPHFAGLISNNNKKARLWTEGRIHIFKKLEVAFSGNSAPVIWVHCASLGEFEQGRPFMERLKLDYPAYKILLTFFSPSGFEIRKDYDQADWVFYLPMDSPSHAKIFYDITNPSIAFFIKYEFWNYYLQEASKRNIPLMLVSGTFRKNQPFFQWYGSFHRNMLHCFTHLFVQTATDKTLLAQIGFQTNVTICGDTRFDRVLTIAKQFEPIPLIESFIGNAQVIVAGSTWTEDDEELNHFANSHPEIRFIIAPHDIDDTRIQECLKLYKHAILFSEFAETFTISDKPCKQEKNVLIIDNIGMLSKLYYYSTISFIGGGFGDDGVHNVLEAAVYNKPLLFGPVYEKYLEAVDLIEQQGAVSVENALELEKELNQLLNNNEWYQTMAANAGSYVQSKSGATQILMNYIQENRLFTS